MSYCHVTCPLLLVREFNSSKFNWKIKHFYIYFIFQHKTVNNLLIKIKISELNENQKFQNHCFINDKELNFAFLRHLDGNALCIMYATQFTKNSSGFNPLCGSCLLNHLIRAFRLLVWQFCSDSVLHVLLSVCNWTSFYRVLSSFLSYHRIKIVPLSNCQYFGIDIWEKESSSIIALDVIDTIHKNHLYK